MRPRLFAGFYRVSAPVTSPKGLSDRIADLHAFALGIIRPGLGQGEGAIDESMSMAAGIGEEHANLTILDAPSRAGGLAVDAGRLGALLEKARLIQHQDRIGIA